MNWLPRLLSALGAVALLHASIARGADADFQPLFSGRDFTGWRFSLQKAGDPLPENWKVKDGVIYLTGAMRPHLVTAREFGDFEVKFEWRALVPKFNGGIYIRSKPDAGSNQIRVDKNFEGAFLAGTMAGAKAVPTLQKATGEWNEWRILVKGTAVTLWCNGKLAWEATGLAPARGHIGFQAEGTPMEFRNLQIRELK
jgi:Domain of Unknown Function (DUF1080)